jgi:hypothetical protein
MKKKPEEEPRLPTKKPAILPVLLIMALSVFSGFLHVTRASASTHIAQAGVVRPAEPTPSDASGQSMPDILQNPSVVVYPNPSDGTVYFYRLDGGDNQTPVQTGVTGRQYRLPSGNYRIVVHNKGDFFHYWHVEMPSQYLFPGRPHEFWPKQHRLLKWNRIIALIILAIMLLSAAVTYYVLKFKRKKDQELVVARTAATMAGVTRLDGIPQAIGKFAVLEKIGQGGMATVFKVQDSYGDIFALKVPHFHIFDIPEFKQRFIREAEIVKNLHHPHIVRMYDYSLGEDYTIPYICFEFVTGVTLKHFIEKNPAMAFNRAATFIIDIASALSYAHSKGVIHRDLKPENVMIGKSFEIKLMDLGIARAADSQQLTRTDATLGTPGYIAPEQIESRDIDHRCDLYSLGIILYELLTGRLPFVSPEPINVVLMHLKERPAPPTSYNAQIPKPLEAIVLRLLEKNPAERIQSAEELINQLRPFAR